MNNRIESSYSNLILWYSKQCDLLWGTIMTLPYSPVYSFDLQMTQMKIKCLCPACPIFSGVILNVRAWNRSWGQSRQCLCYCRAPVMWATVRWSCLAWWTRSLPSVPPRTWSTSRWQWRRSSTQPARPRGPRSSQLTACHSWRTSIRTAKTTGYVSGHWWCVSGLRAL